MKLDNLTHTLAGLVTAEAAVQVRRARGDTIDPGWARTAWIVSAAAHNVPDLDFVYTWITEGALGYLLHHRGHTHTLASVPLMAALAYVLVSLWQRRPWRGEPLQGWSRAEQAWLITLAGLGPIGHMLLDLSNSYGVHPFWPASNRWFAGDTIFIVEPLFWAATIPLIALATRTRWGRRAWWIVLGAGLAAPWLAPFVPWPFALATTCLAVAVAVASQRIGQGARVGVALVASAGVLAVFAVSGRAAEAHMRRVLGEEYPTFVTIDVVRSPIPSTPACWEAIAVQEDRDGRAALRLARVSAWAPWVPVDACTRAAREDTTAPLSRPAWRREGVWLEGELETSTVMLRGLAARCDALAYLRFARAPFAVQSGEGITLGDLRFDREAGASFAEIEIPRNAPGACPSSVPPWEPWRARDWLAAPAR